MFTMLGPMSIHPHTERPPRRNIGTVPVTPCQMATMRAAVMKAIGGPEVLEYQPRHPVPERKPGEVLVNVHATSVNPLDWMTRKGDVPKVFIAVPQILAGDLAGVVAEADAGSKFKVGDAVFAFAQQPLWSRWGTYSEMATTKESQLVAIPPGFSMAAAASVPLAGMTAWQALVPTMPLKGKRVLFHAGAGGVGHFGIQIAKAQGAHVTTTCSTRNIDFVKSLGADVAVDYSKGEKFEDNGPYDVVVDSIGGLYEPRGLGALRKGGHYTNILSGGWVRDKGMLVGGALQAFYMFKALCSKALSTVRLAPSYSFVFTSSEASKGLVQIADLMTAGKLKPHIEKVFPPEDAAGAHALAEKGGFRGKVAIRCTPEPSK